MGGQNHQPCNRSGTDYLKLSTMMSRALSVGRAELEVANISLEDVLLTELEGRSSRSVASVLAHLDASQSALTDMRRVIAALRFEMDEHAFEDLPTLHSAELTELGSLLTASGVVTGEAWQAVCEQMRQDGFYGMLDAFDTHLCSILALTQQLRDCISRSETAARSGILNVLLEQNRPGNFKREFASLYSSWNRFQQLYLASSILSTELWYRFCGVGSLLEHGRPIETA